MQKLEDDVLEKAKQSAPRIPPFPPSSSLGGTSNFFQSGIPLKKRKGDTSGSASGSQEGRNPIMDCFNIAKRDRLHSEIARMYYSGGLPFHLARNPYYVSSYAFAASNSLVGYLPPGYNLLRTTLLQKEKANIQNLLQPIRATWKEKGVSFVSDGWSDPQKRPIINCMAVTEGGPMFLKAVDCSGEVKDKFFIAALFKEVINDMGPENVVQVLTDNAPNCKAAGQLIEAQFPTIFWTPCVVHALNLALKNICEAKNADNNQITYDECSWITEVYGDVMQIKNFIVNHSMSLSIFNKYSTMKLLSVADTRFASVIVMLRRFKLLKQSLQTMVISKDWSSYWEDDVGRARYVRDMVLDEVWWDKINYVIAFPSPIYDMLRKCDTDTRCLHLVYDLWDSMIEKVKGVIYREEGKRKNEWSSFYDVVHTILVDHWNKNNTPLHCMAHSLNPRYYSDEWLSEDPNRVPPHKDSEIYLERQKCIKRFFPNSADRSKVNTEFAQFCSKSEIFNDIDSINDRVLMSPHNWWSCHGSPAPMLQTLALKLLKQPASSSCVERNWSTYSLVHSLRRNKLTPQRAEDLVFVHSNLRLLLRRSPQYAQGPTKMWDVGGDQFGTVDDVGVLAIAELSLDEPELEAILFTDDGDGEIDEDEDVVAMEPLDT